MTVEISIEGGVQTIRMNRPEKKNALNNLMYDAICDALQTGDQSPDVAVHVLTGSNGVFSAGNDLNEFLEFAANGALGQSVLKFLRAIATVQKPLIAAVDGLAVGIGTTMLFHCDLVYASENAVFRTPFLDLGLVPEAASSLLFPQRTGYARAFELLCLGQTFDSTRAQQAGFVNEVVPSNELEPYSRQVALQLVAKPPQALKLARQLLRGAPDAVLARIDEEADMFADRLRSPEAREAFTAFLEKRPPDFEKLRGAE